MWALVEWCYSCVKLTPFLLYHEYRECTETLISFRYCLAFEFGTVWSCNRPTKNLLIKCSEKGCVKNSHTLSRRYYRSWRHRCHTLSKIPPVPVLYYHQRVLLFPEFGSCVRMIPRLRTDQSIHELMAVLWRWGADKQSRGQPFIVCGQLTPPTRPPLEDIPTAEPQPRLAA